MRYTGKDYDEFWRRTPAEYSIVVRGHLERAKDDHKSRMVVAYANGLLTHIAHNNPKKFPKSQDFLKEKTRRVAASLDEQRAVLAALARGSGNGS